jgi:hypothetical protein
MEKKAGQPNFLRKAGATLAAIVSLGGIGLAGCSVFDGPMLPDCKTTEETVSVEEAREAYRGSDIYISTAGQGEPRTRQFAYDIENGIGCLQETEDGRPVLVVNKQAAERRGAVFTDGGTTTVPES